MERTSAGWHIDPISLREVLDDLPVAESAMATADATERIWLLILLHRIDQASAEGEAMMTATADPFRSSMLLAQAYQRAGRFDDARRLQSAILLTTTGTAREAVVRQHIGKRLVDEGHWPAALDQFEQALQLWVARGADWDLIESSVLAIRRTREVLSRGTGNPGAAGSIARQPESAPPKSGQNLRTAR